MQHLISDTVALQDEESMCPSGVAVAHRSVQSLGVILFARWRSGRAE